MKHDQVTKQIETDRFAVLRDVHSGRQVHKILAIIVSITNNQLRCEKSIEFARRFILATSFVLSAAPFVLADDGKSAERPNILFIMSDDHTSQAIDVYG